MTTIELFALPDDTLTDISLVEFPAIESGWLCFSKDDGSARYMFADDERHIVTGAALIPDKPIYRRDQSGEYNVFFSRQTVRTISEQFFRDFGPAQDRVMRDLFLPKEEAAAEEEAAADTPADQAAEQTEE